MSELNEIVKCLEPYNFANNREPDEEETRKVIEKLIRLLEDYPDYVFELTGMYLEMRGYKGSRLFYIIDLAHCKMCFDMKAYGAFFSGLYDLLDFKILERSGPPFYDTFVPNDKLPQNIKYGMLKLLYEARENL